MIGVIADSAEKEVIREFFELFKTPWEFYRRDCRYDIVLSSDVGPFDTSAKLIVIYSGRKTQFDDEQRILIGRHSKAPCFLRYQSNRFPLYGETIAFATKKTCLLTDEDSKECVAFLDESEGRVLVRIGYDLFGEIRSLLTVGQPAANAALPTLELHISFLRD